MIKNGEFDPQKTKNIGGNPKIYGRTNRKISGETQNLFENTKKLQGNTQKY